MRLLRRTVSNVYGIFVLRNALSQCWVWSVAKTVKCSILESHCVQRPTIVTMTSCAESLPEALDPVLNALTRELLRSLSLHAQPTSSAPTNPPLASSVTPTTTNHGSACVRSRTDTS